MKENYLVGTLITEIERYYLSSGTGLNNEAHGLVGFLGQVSVQKEQRDMRAISASKIAAQTNLRPAANSLHFLREVTVDEPQGSRRIMKPEAVRTTLYLYQLSLPYGTWVDSETEGLIILKGEKEIKQAQSGFDAVTKEALDRHFSDGA